MADSTDTPDSAAHDHAATPGSARGAMWLDPRRILWLVVLAVAGAVVLLGIWLFRTVSTERALRAVTSSVSLPANPAPAPVPVAATPAPPPAPPVTPVLPPVDAVVTPASSAAPDAEERKAVRNVKPKKTHQAAKRRGRVAERGTFARCPALGKPGAVMCRWHICNGGAGKEAACRPYLERRP